MNCSKPVAIAVIVALVWGTPLHAGPDLKTDDFMQSIATFGIGADVAIELKNGNKIRGTVDSFDPAQVRLFDKEQPIAFESMKELKVIKATYRDQASRANRVQSAVQGLGFTQEVKLRLVSGKTVKGWVRQSGADVFDLVSKGKAAITTIAYDEVQDIWPGAISRALPPAQSPRRNGPSVKNFAVGFAVIMALLITGCSRSSNCSLP